jgi:hypothetical protein
MGKARYFVASMPEAEVAPAVRGALFRASIKRGAQNVIVWLLGASLYVAFFAGCLFVLVRGLFISSYEPAQRGLAGASDMAYLFAGCWVFFALQMGLYLYRNFGARLSHASILWLRRFHVRDGEQSSFRRRLGKITPLTFALTLRDSMVMGSVEEGYRRIAPMIALAIGAGLAVVLLWEHFSTLCLATAHRCEIIDRIWMMPLTADEAQLRQDLRPYTIVFVIGMTSMITYALVIIGYRFVARRAGFVAPPSVEATRDWYDGLLRKGSAAITYVMRTADSFWQETVEHAYRNSKLVVFDLTHPSRHLEFELGLISKYPHVRTMFICREGGSLQNETAFFGFVEQHAPSMAPSLKLSSLTKRGVLTEMRRQAEAAL